MLQKLSEEKQTEILEAGISEFAQHGLERTAMKDVAQRAGVSVGAIYKYYGKKEAFFFACLTRSLGVLEEELQKMLSKQDKPLGYARQLVKTLRWFSREHGDHIRLYHKLTGEDRYADALCRKIEGMTSRLYVDFIRQAQKNGDMRSDLDPALGAFFFDNLLMMMQFSYSCPYYQERFRLYCGDTAQEDDEYVAEQLLAFLESAFTFEKNQISHRKEEEK